MIRLWSAVLPLSTVAIVADELRGKVVSIADGDTITVLDADKKQHKVRLNGIDAPEKAQAVGAKSKARLGKLAAGSLPQRLSLIEVDVAPDAPVEGVWRHWEPRFLGLAVSASPIFALYLASKMSLASATDIAIAAS